MIRGSCLCGSVRYEITGPLLEIHHCHCSRCRKAHGAAFSTYGQTTSGNFRFAAGADKIRYFQSSPPVQRGFCSDCGSTLTYHHDALPQAVWVAAGTFDDDPGKAPEFHMFVGSKAPWHDIADALPRFQTLPS